MTVHRAMPNQNIRKKKEQTAPRDTTLDHEIMFLSVIVSRSMIGNPIISLSYILRLWLEIVGPRNANVISEFYPHEIFHEGANFEIFF